MNNTYDSIYNKGLPKMETACSTIENKKAPEFPGLK